MKSCANVVPVMLNTGVSVVLSITTVAFAVEAQTKSAKQAAPVPSPKMFFMFFMFLVFLWFLTVYLELAAKLSEPGFRVKRDFLFFLIQLSNRTSRPIYQSLGPVSNEKSV